MYYNYKKLLILNNVFDIITKKGGITLFGIASNEIFWIAAIIIFSAAEAATSGLVSIWFAGGALAGLIAAMLNADIWVQTTVFFAVSIILLIALRGIAVNSFKNRSSKTDIDRIIGQHITVEDVEENNTDAIARINDVEWKIRSNDGSRLEKGEVVKVEKIDGVRLIVSK